MNTVRLDEQMGAMALIDALREQQLRVDEHLDLPRRREAIAQRIREYYEAHGQKVDDELIDAGVKAYFADRLTFRPHGIKGGQARLVRAYLSRDAWLPKVRAIALSVALLAGIGGGVYVVGQAGAQMFEGWRAAEAIKNLDAQANAIRAGKAKHEALWQELQGHPIRYAKVMAAGLLESQGAAIRAVPDLVRPESATPAEWGQIVERATQAMAAVVDHSEVARRLIVADQRLVEIEDGPEFASLKGDRELTRLAAAARDALKGPVSVPHAESAIAAVNALGVALERDMASLALRNELPPLKAQFDALSMNAKDRAVIEDFFVQVSQQLRNDPPAAMATVGKIRGFLAFAGQEIELRVVNREGVKSGVRRTYNETGGNAWYVIVEAVGPSGMTVPVPVTSVESGKLKFATQFGVRVTEGVFERVKLDKQTDGVVDDRVFATKERGRLEFDFNRAVMPGMITEW